MLVFLPQLQPRTADRSLPPSRHDPAPANHRRLETPTTRTERHAATCNQVQRLAGSVSEPDAGSAGRRGESWQSNAALQERLADTNTGDGIGELDDADKAVIRSTPKTSSAPNEDLAVPVAPPDSVHSRTRDSLIAERPRRPPLPLPLQAPRSSVR